jgi:hypothetical protein
VSLILSSGAEYIEERERLAQLRDEAVARQFWAFKFAERLI